jgi:uncharacterized protein YjbI with pentapeptide repeats
MRHELRLTNSAVHRYSGRVSMLLIVAVALVIMVVIAASVFFIPTWFVSRRASRLTASLTPEKQLEAENDVRGTLLQAFAALAIVLTLWQVLQTQQSAQQTQETTQKQLALTEQSQISDRFTTAVGQLGSSKTDIRLGAIFSLDRIGADEAPTYGRIVVNILDAFVRDHADLPIDRNGNPIMPSTMHVQVRDLSRSRPDIQAAMTILAQHAQQGGVPINLPGVNLESVQLPDAHLAGADMSESFLVNASFEGANLKGAKFLDSQLKYCHLGKANLTGASLIGARLRWCNMSGAILTGADLMFAKLQHAGLTKADFTDADLTLADLTGLRRHDLHGATFTDATLGGARMHRGLLSHSQLRQALDAADIDWQQ